jgi:hypothetical protein
MEASLKFPVSFLKIYSFRSNCTGASIVKPLWPLRPTVVSSPLKLGPLKVSALQVSTLEAGTLKVSALKVGPF